MVHSSIPHTKIEELRVARPWTKVPAPSLCLLKNHPVLHTAVFVPVCRFRYGKILAGAFVTHEHTGVFHPSDGRDEQNSVLCGKCNESTAAHNRGTPFLTVSRRNMLRE